jgi:hypothetical protein
VDSNNNDQGENPGELLLTSLVCKEPRHLKVDPNPTTEVDPIVVLKVIITVLINRVADDDVHLWGILELDLILTKTVRQVVVVVVVHDVLLQTQEEDPNRKKRRLRIITVDPINGDLLRVALVTGQETETTTNLVNLQKGRLQEDLQVLDNEVIRNLEPTLKIITTKAITTSPNLTSSKSSRNLLQQHNPNRTHLIHQPCRSQGELPPRPSHAQAVECVLTNFIV